MSTATNTTPIPARAAPDDGARARLVLEYKQVALRLHATFDNQVGAEHVDEQFCAVIERYEQATVLTFIPVLVEREVRNALKQSRSTVG